MEKRFPNKIDKFMLKIKNCKPKAVFLAISLVLVGGGVAIVMATSNPNTWTDGLVAYWSFDGQYTTSTNGTRDVSGNNNWGTFSGGVKPVGGISGQALKFDGVDDYVDAGNGASLDITSVNSSGVTLEAWIKIQSYTPWAGVVGKRESGYHGYSLLLVSGNVLLDIDGLAQPTKAFSLNTWQHVVGVYNNQQAVVYVNGVSGTPVNLANGLTSSLNNVYIGKLSYGSFLINGLIDEVRIYNRALSADEVKIHYEQTRRNLKTNQPSGAPPVAWWKMDENPVIHESIIRDYSANANNGTASTSDGTTNKSVDGKIGKAMTFDGTNDYVRATVSQSNTAAGGYNTVEFWMKWSGVSGSLPFSSGGLYNFWIVSASCMGFNYGYSDNYGFNATNLNLTNQWHHVALILYNGVYTNQNKIYIDGISQTLSQCAGSAQSCTFSSDVVVGASAGNSWVGQYPFNGSIDDVRIYNYARTAEQIAADYRAGAYRTTVATSNPNNWSDGLVGYWNFDGQYTTSTNGTKDVSGNNNWGTFNNGVDVDAGISGQALKFDGVDDYVSCSTSVFSATQLTGEAWIKTSVNSGGNYDRILNPNTWLPGFIMATVENTGTFRVYLWDDDEDSLTGIKAVNDNNWHHVLFTWTVDGTIKIYIDGKLDNSKTGSSVNTTINVNSNFVIGKGQYFNGLIDEVRIYNRALSADEVKMHYEQTRRNIKI